jgi:hypothetical protein
MAINDNNPANFPLGVPLGASGTNMNNQQFGMLKTLGGSADAAQQAMAFANQLYPSTPKADPWEAAFQFFAEMGRQASVPGSTALGAAASSLQAPMDYLAAKKKEKIDEDRARLQTAVSLAPSLKEPKETYDKPDFYMVSKRKEDGTFTDPVETALTPKQFSELPTDGSVKVTSVPKDSTSTTFKERKFYKTGFPVAVVKNKIDADAFEADATWSTIPPEGWEDDTSVTEVQSSKILDGGVVVTVMKDGTTKVLDATGNELEGDKRKEAIRQAEDRGITIQGERAGQRRAAVVAVNTSLSAFDQVSKSRSNIANLEEAKRLVAEEGANTGVIANRLPNWKASTVALETVKNELGLDVVGSVTFGALSQGELTLALNTALPTNLSEDALVDWIDRKIIAQRKLQDYLYAQAVYLADGDKTIGDWLRSQKTDLEERKRADAERRQSKNNFNFSVMPIQELREIDTDSLTDSEFDAWDKRMTELGY